MGSVAIQEGTGWAEGQECMKCVQPATADLAKVHKGRRSDPCPQLKLALQVLRWDTNLQCFRTSEKFISWFYLVKKKYLLFIYFFKTITM